MQRDVFISHAREDRAAIAHPLAAALQRHGLDVWRTGRSSPRATSSARVDEGLARAGWGVLVISAHFLRMEWPRAELDGLLAREMGPERLIIPVWHGVTAADVARRSPILAARLAVDTDDGDRCRVRGHPRPGRPAAARRGGAGRGAAVGAAGHLAVAGGEPRLLAGGRAPAPVPPRGVRRPGDRRIYAAGAGGRGCVGRCLRGRAHAAGAAGGAQALLPLRGRPATGHRRPRSAPSAASRPCAIRGSPRCWTTATCASASARRRTWCTSR